MINKFREFRLSFKLRNEYNLHFLLVYMHLIELMLLKTIWDIPAVLSCPFLLLGRTMGSLSRTVTGNRALNILVYLQTRKVRPRGINQEHSMPLGWPRMLNSKQTEGTIQQTGHTRRVWIFLFVYKVLQARDSVQFLHKRRETKSLNK